MYLDPVPGVFGQDAGRERTNQRPFFFVGFGLDIDVVFAEAGEIDALLFGFFIEFATIGDIGIDSDQIRVAGMSAVEAGGEEDRCSEPEIVAFFDVIRRVAVEDAPRRESIWCFRYAP